MFRFVYITFLSAQYLIKFKLQSRARPRILREYFEKAGGAFIKFGQILALRVDSLPKEYFLELVGLFDHIKPFPYSEVERIIITELGNHPKEIFSYFEKEPFASASFGQVHAAKLGNEKVIVKIQRPGLNHLLFIDFFIIDLLSIIADMFFKIEAMPWREVASEFRIWTQKEIDYQIEAANAQTIYDNLKNAGIENVIIPKTYHYLTTRKVLVQQYIKGISVSRILTELKNKTVTFASLKEMGYDIHRAPVILVTEMMRQYFFDDFFHADPHPGNILVLPDNKIALLDFGIVGKSAPHKIDFMKFTLAGAEGNYDEVGYHFLKFAGVELEQIIGSIMPANLDPEFIDDLLHKMGRHFSVTARAIEDKVRKDLDDMKMDYSSMFLSTLKITSHYQVKLPKEMTAFIRALSVMGFMAKELDDNFYLTAIVLNFVKKYPIASIPKREWGSSTYKRLSKEEALEKFNNWMAYLFEKDPKLYELVDAQVSAYNSK